MTITVIEWVEPFFFFCSFDSGFSIVDRCQLIRTLNWDSLDLGRTGEGVVWEDGESIMNHRERS